MAKGGFPHYLVYAARLVMQVFQDQPKGKAQNVRKVFQKVSLRNESMSHHI